jgi:hypothetical protein
VHFTDYDTRLAAYALIVDDADRILLTWYVGGPHSPACWGDRLTQLSCGGVLSVGAGRPDGVPLDRGWVVAEGVFNSRRFCADKRHYVN